MESPLLLSGGAPYGVTPKTRQRQNLKTPVLAVAFLWLPSNWFELAAWR